MKPGSAFILGLVTASVLYLLDALFYRFAGAGLWPLIVLIGS